MEERALLEVRNLTAGYGTVPVLRELTLQVNSGEMVALIGANGAGKTTLLRAITGIARVFEGEMWFGGQRIDGWRPAQRVRAGIAHVAEGRQLFGGLSVLDNLLLGAAFVPEAWPKREESLRAVHALFPRLAERTRQAVGTMSGGEQQMLAIGRALMSSPRLLLVDEPSMGLAPALVQSVLQALRRVNEEAGVAVLLVEQNVHQTLGVCERAYVLENGRIVLQGPARELLESPMVRAAYLGA